MEQLVLRIVRAIRKAYETDKVLRAAGYDETPYFDIYGELLDGLYDWCGEKANTLEESEVYIIMHTVSLTDKRRVALLLDTHEKNRPAQN